MLQTSTRFPTARNLRARYERIRAKLEWQEFNLAVANGLDTKALSEETFHTAWQDAVLLAPVDDIADVERLYRDYVVITLSDKTEATQQRYIDFHRAKTSNLGATPRVAMTQQAIPDGAQIERITLDSDDNEMPDLANDDLDDIGFVLSTETPSASPALPLISYDDLSAMSLTQLQSVAQDYGIESKARTKQTLMAAVVDNLGSRDLMA